MTALDRPLHSAGLLAERDLLSRVATDMTLILAAESHVAFHTTDDRSVPFDPRGAESFRTFVDLFVNVESLLYTLPAATMGGSPPLAGRLSDGIAPLPNASGVIHPAIEESLPRRFTMMARHPGYDWLSEWIRFQLINPLVSDGHRNA